MNSAINDDVPATAVAGAPNAPLPVIEVRFSAVYAWMGIGFGVICFPFGLLIALLNHRNLGFGLFISLVSLVAGIGANYWRQHRHVVAQLTPQQLILRRDGVVNWDNIAAIENKEMRSTSHGVRNKSEFVCIKLKNRPAPKNGWDGFFLKAKRAITGYDIIVPANDMSCTADWFIAECRKRMAAGASSCSWH